MHVIAVLKRFQAGVLSPEAVEAWANAVEGREDIGLEPESSELLEEAIFDLANPVLQGALTGDTVERWIQRLMVPSVR